MIKRVYNRAKATIVSTLHDGTCNNGLSYGTFTTNLNNAFSNTNWNNDACLAYSGNNINAVVYPRDAEINSNICSLVRIIRKRAREDKTHEVL